MNERRFNNFMYNFHHEWAADVLGMEHNLSNRGPDLLWNDGEDRSFVELKWALVPSINITTRYPKAWTVDEKQMDYPKTYGKGYWGLGLYTMNRKVQSIRESELTHLGDFVTNRELWIVRWRWMDRYKPSHVSGETSQSSWDTYLRYPKFKDRPSTKRTYCVEGGKIHITSYVNEEYFFPQEQVDLDVPF